MSENQAAGVLPLAGITVIEFGASVAGPYAGQVLGDLGARVIKIEKPEGDDARKWGPPFLEGASAIFQALNRNKASIACDLRDAPTLNALTKLIIDEADVVLHNMRPGQMEQVGLGASALLAAKPALVYCNLGAFGANGPLADRPGYDPLMQAFGGIMSVTGERGRPPVRVGVSIVDMGTGVWAVVGILAKLLERKTTGRGGEIDVSLFETAAALFSLPLSQYIASGELPVKHGSGAAGIVPYRAYRTADGDLVVGTGNDVLYRKFCDVLAKPEWASDPRFKTNPDRVKNETTLYPLLETEMLTRSNAEWIKLLDAAGVPCAPVHNAREMLSHPQTAALGLQQAIPGSGMRLIGLPVSFDGKRPAPRTKPPALGEHNALLKGESK
jgi:crotonobetainyl-CoA:carnitine CoA-transferase CaiB-like acyl-CoA transferase